MSYTVHEETYRGCKIRLEADDDPLNPRKEWDNVGTMVCWHRRYNLGDEQPKEDPQDYMRELEDGRFVILPLYLYEHSGITISTGRFSCPWDSGQVGFIYCSLEKAIAEWGGTTWDSLVIYGKEQMPLREVVARVLESEVKVYDDYLTGDVVGFVIEDWDGEQVDSCWGFFPDHDVHYSERWEYPLSEARSHVDYYVDHYHEKADLNHSEH